MSIVALKLFMFIDSSPALQGEPVSMTIFPNQGAHKAQSHLSGGTHMLDRAEAAERSAYLPSAGAQRRNVILIVGDALRSDHMGVYGYARPTTPYLQALARDRPMEKVGHMTSVCAESACGLLALAVSRYVYDVPQHPMSLQEVLRRHGYKVHMILGGDHTNFYGLREAYGEVDSYFDASTQNLRYLNDDQLVLDRTTDLPANDPAQPVMLQFHLMSSHALGLRHGASLRFQPWLNYSSWVTFGRAAPTDASELAKAVNFYDNGVAQFDLMVQQLLMHLQQKGYLEDALVVITGDHGEMLGEHGEFGHTKQVYEAGLRVPLLLIRYGYEGAPLTTNRLASQVDVAPTILWDLHIPKPTTWRGFPLQESNERELIQFQQKALTGVYDLRRPRQTLKYWKDFASEREYVFDITSDPQEQHNLFDQTDTDDLSWWRREVMTSALVVPPKSFDAAP